MSFLALGSELSDSTAPRPTEDCAARTRCAGVCRPQPTERHISDSRWYGDGGDAPELTKSPQRQHGCPVIRTSRSRGLDKSKVLRKTPSRCVYDSPVQAFWVFTVMQLLVASMFGMTISGRDRSPFGSTVAVLSSAASASHSSPHIRVAMTKSTPLVAGALGTALYFTSPSFVPPAAPHAATAAPENIQRSAPAGGAFGLGATAVTAAAAMGSVAAARQRVARKAEAVLEEAEPPFDPKKEPGVTLPLFYFDPLGFAKEGDREGFYQLRSAELKHGRVAMIASLGMVFQHWFRLPGFEDVPSGIQAAITPPGTFGLLAIVALGGALEFTIFKQDPEMDPGDFGDPAGFGQTYTEWKDRELNNCRMGMVSFLGIVVAELATGKDGVEQIWTPLGNLKPE
eukprot:s813_g19.t1